MIDVAFAPMEDLSIEDLIADVIANPMPDRMSCQSTTPPIPSTGTITRLVRATVRRIRDRLR